MNICTFIGRIGKDAVTRHTTAGKQVTGWPIAVDSGFGDAKKTLWFDCSFWGERGGKVCDYIRKGDRIGVAGELGTREHDGKTYLTLNVRELTLLGEKRETSGDGSSRVPQPAPARSDPSASADDNFDDDEIPF